MPQNCLDTKWPFCKGLKLSLFVEDISTGMEIVTLTGFHVERAKRPAKAFGPHCGPLRTTLAISEIKAHT